MNKKNIFLGCENKQTTFAAGVLGADKGMFLALCAEDSRENKHYQAGVIDGGGGGEGEFIRQENNFSGRWMDYSTFIRSNFPIFSIISSQGLYLGCKYMIKGE